jgi:hypothetical protein
MSDWCHSMANDADLFIDYKFPDFDRPITLFSSDLQFTLKQKTAIASATANVFAL